MAEGGEGGGQRQTRREQHKREGGRGRQRESNTRGRGTEANTHRAIQPCQILGSLGAVICLGVGTRFVGHVAWVARRQCAAWPPESTGSVSANAAMKGELAPGFAEQGSLSLSLSLPRIQHAAYYNKERNLGALGIALSLARLGSLGRQEARARVSGVTAALCTHRHLQPVGHSPAPAWARHARGVLASAPQPHLASGILVAAAAQAQRRDRRRESRRGRG